MCHTCNTYPHFLHYQQCGCFCCSSSCCFSARRGKEGGFGAVVFMHSCQQEKLHFRRRLTVPDMKTAGCVHVHSTTMDVLHSVSNRSVASTQVNKKEKAGRRKRRIEDAVTSVCNDSADWLLGPLWPQGQIQRLFSSRKCQRLPGGLPFCRVKFLCPD